MVAPRKTRKIFCTVVRVSVADDSGMRASNPRFDNDSLNNPIMSRPSDLLPWADPYIARLVAKLQNEVRDERTQARVVSQDSRSCLAELEPPVPGTDSEWDDQPRWSIHDET